MPSLPVSLLIISVVYVLSSQAACPNTSGTRWATSQPTTAGSSVYIPPGSSVVLDQSPGITYSAILINGTLTIANAQLELLAASIMIGRGGQLIAGSSDCPITSRVTITLCGRQNSAPDLGFDDDGTAFGQKGFIVANGGSIQLYGKVTGPTWTTLSTTATATSATITVSDSVNWQVGDQIVVASTDFSEVLDFRTYGSPDYDQVRGQPFPDQNEVFTIAAINGKTITLSSALKFTHWGKDDERAEVGLLTRRIVVQSDTVTAGDSFGGHFMMRKGPLTKVVGVEFTQLGQLGILARYPVHFHNMRDTFGLGVLVDSCSIHDNFQRSVVIHESYGVTVSNNVAFNTTGHMYFLEDGGEYANVFNHNLGIRARSIPASSGKQLIPTDITPAIFWITNPYNNYSNNAAVSGFHGFWYSMPEHPLHLGAKNWAGSDFAWPRRLPLGLFDSNVAHTMFGSGIHIDDMMKPDETTEMAHYSPLTGPYNTTSSGTKLDAKFTNCLVYKCRAHGVWGKSDMHFINLRALDNSVAFMVNGQSLLENSVITGETDNVGNPSLSPVYKSKSRVYPDQWGNPTVLAGHSTYDNGGPQLGVGNTFINFAPNSDRPAGALVSLRFGPFMLFPRNQYRGLTFVNSNQVWIEYTNLDAQYGWNIQDMDGSITGVAGGAWIQSNTTLFRRTGCTLRNEWNAYVCPQFGEGYVQFIITTNSLSAGNGKVEYTTTKGQRPIRAIIYPLGGSEEGNQGTSAGASSGGSYIYMQNVIARSAYKIKFIADDGSLGTSPSSFTFNMQSSSPGEWIILAIPYPTGTTFTVTNQGYPYNQFSQATSFADLSPGEYIYDSATQHLYLFAVNQASGASNSFHGYFGYGVPDSGFYSPLTVTASCTSCAGVDTIPPFPATLPGQFTPETYFASLDACQASSGSDRSGSAFFYLSPQGWSGNVELNYKIFHDLDGTENTLTLNSGAVNQQGSPIVTRVIPFGNSAVQDIMYITRDQWQQLASGNLYINVASNGQNVLRGQILCVGSCSKPPAASTSSACNPPYDIMSLYSDVNFPAPLRANNYSDPKYVLTANLNYQGDKLCGTSSMRLGLQGNFYGVSWWYSSTDLKLDSKYQSLEFYIKVAPGYGEYSIGVVASNETGTTGAVTASRQNIDNLIIDELTWSRVRIPLSALGLTGRPNQKLKTLGFRSVTWPPVYTEVLIDEWRFTTAGIETLPTASIDVATYKSLCANSAAAPTVGGGKTTFLEGKTNASAQLDVISAMLGALAMLFLVL